MLALNRPLRLVVVLLVAASAAVVVGVSTSGQDASDTDVDVPGPREGDVYRYRGANGSYLNVTVDGQDLRLAGDLTERRGVQLSWTLENSPRPWDDLTQPFRQTVAPDGTRIQTLSLCGPFRAQGEDWQCYDERAHVQMAATGLPGALGAGPFWGESIAGSETVEVDNPLVGTASLTYEASEAQAPFGDCARLEATPGELATRPRPVEWTVVGGPVVLCSEIALPAAFTPVNPELASFRLVEHEPGDGPILDPQPRVEDTGVDIETYRPQAPFLIDPEPPEAGEVFTVREAHRAALEESEAYRELFAGEEAWVVDTHFLRSRGRDTLPGQPVSRTQDTYERSLEAVNADGDEVRVELEKEVTRYDVATETFYRNQTDLVHEETGHREKIPLLDRLPEQQASTSSTLDVGHLVANATLVSGMHGTEYTLDVRGPTYGMPIDRTDGYTVYGWFEDAHQSQDPSPPGVSAPYAFAVDGPTSHLLWFEIPEFELPVTAEDLG